MRAALILDGKVSNVGIYSLPLPNNVVSIEGIVPQPGIGWLYNGTTFESPEEISSDSLIRPNHITVGSLKDRMGMDALAIAVSSHPVCVALREMLYDRKFIDLDRPQTAQFLDMLINASQPAADPNFPGSGPMTESKKNLILSTNIQEMERP